jgi:hypothetical protein
MKSCFVVKDRGIVIVKHQLRVSCWADISVVALLLLFLDSGAKELALGEDTFLGALA